MGGQVGGESLNLLMVLTSDKARRELYKGNFRMAGDLSAMAGPTDKGVGTSLENADVLSYTKSRAGLFAGADVNGSTLSQDDDTTRILYGKKVPLGEILQGAESMPNDQASASFIAALREAFFGAPVSLGSPSSPSSPK